MQKENIELRLATSDDAKMLVDFCRETFYSMWKDYNTDEDLDTYMNQYFTVDVITEELNDPNISYLIASIDKKTIGYCKLKRNYKEGNLPFNQVVELQRMYTTQKTIRKGIGSALMNYAIELMRKENFEVIWLGVYEKNFRAIAFYQHFEFTPYGSHDFVLGNDITTDILMKLPL